MKSPDGYRRITIWQPASGYAADLYSRDFKRAATPVFTPEYFDAGDGSDYVMAIDRVLEVQGVDESKLEHLWQMYKIGCPVRLFAAGYTKSVLWLGKTAMDLVPNRPGATDLAGDNLRFRNASIYAPIYDTWDVLEPFNWIGKEITESGGVYYVTGEEGLDALIKWQINGATTPPIINELGQLETDGQAVLEFQLPIGGASFLLRSNGNGQGVSNRRVALFTMDDIEVGSVGTDLTVTMPARTWKVRAEMNPAIGNTMKAEYPSLYLVEPGRYNGAAAQRSGRIPATCDLEEPAALPAWQLP